MSSLDCDSIIITLYKDVIATGGDICPKQSSRRVKIYMYKYRNADILQI